MGHSPALRARWSPDSYQPATRPQNQPRLDLLRRGALACTSNTGWSPSYRIPTRERPPRELRDHCTDAVTVRGRDLVGFVVVHDRDDDGDYESIAHIWTATAWRRRGVAAQLVRAARDLMPINAVEEPITGSGQALLGSVASDLLEPADESESK